MYTNVRCINIYNHNALFGCSFDYYVVFLFVSCYTLCFKIYLVQYVYSYTSFLFASICMVPVFPTLNLQSASVYV